MGADVDGEHVGPGHGGGEHSALGVHPSPEVGLGPSEGQVLLAPVVVVLSSERVKVNGERLGHEISEQRVFLKHLVSQVLEAISARIQLTVELLS